MSEKRIEWPFDDVKNTAVFTSRSIMELREWIYYVSHDLDDGAWQFHPYSGPAPEGQAVVCALSEIWDIDNAVGDLNDLPLGWCAWRQSKNSGWIRKEIS